MVKLITVDPGHFHAALIQKEMYPEVAPRVSVYAPLGADLIEHLKRIWRFNARAENPTAWELDVHAGPDFLARMLAERPGNVVVISGRNRRKIELIGAAVEAGLHVLADKPWIISPADLPKLEAALDGADRGGAVAYDIMTERYEITSILQRELVRDRKIFGSPVDVTMESVHYIMKMVAGVANLRPAWFFDVEEQGEALADVGTHLVDLVQWTLFPEDAVDWRQEIQMLAARRWPTVLSPEQFRAVTGESRGETLDYYCNTHVEYAIRGVPVSMDVMWKYEAAPGTGDTYRALFRGSTCAVEIRQGEAERYVPELYVVGGDREAVRRRVEDWQASWPGVGIREVGKDLWITVPQQYRVGHEAHFAQVTRQFFRYLEDPGSVPGWEKAGMMAKYFVSTTGVSISRGAVAAKRPPA